ncbi:MAG: response regulator [Candidatus Omnitrophica bacterium]|nr:response regulator [Candidatus Omnitrophota bacterium]
MADAAVLVADDEAPVRATLVKFLKSLGVTDVLEASNGVEAVERVKGAPSLKLILLDLKMPVQDGLKTLEAIRAINPKVEIVILTGYPFYGEADQVAQKHGVLDFTVKPVDLDYLERIITTALTKSSLPPKTP